MSQLSSAFKGASLVTVVFLMFLVLKFNLLVAILALCSTYALATSLPSTWLFKKLGQRAQTAATFVIALIPILILIGIGVSIGYLGQHANAAYLDIVQELGRILAQWREKVPVAFAAYLPVGPEAVKPWLGDLVKSQAETLASMGKSSAHGFLMVIVGGVIGLLIANTTKKEVTPAPLSAALAERATNLDLTFRSIIVAQFWIASINTALTALFFYAIVPLMGMEMPYALALLSLTFLAGMLPVVGNLVCNTATTLVALSVGPALAVSALIFLILIHKLEYVINAKVVGSRMKMTAWELLCAMFVLEAVFGVAGLVAAPFFYAYLKAEFRELGWV